MHPIIREFPSSYFYSGRLEDGCSNLEKSADWHKDIRFGPLVVSSKLNITAPSFDVHKSCRQLVIRCMKCGDLYMQYAGL